MRDMNEMIADAKKAKLVPLLPFNIESRRLIGILQKVSMEIDTPMFIEAFIETIEECRRNYDISSWTRKFSS